MLRTKDNVTVVSFQMSCDGVKKKKAHSSLGSDKSFCAKWLTTTGEESVCSQSMKSPCTPRRSLSCLLSFPSCQLSQRLPRSQSSASTFLDNLEEEVFRESLLTTLIPLPFPRAPSYTYDTFGTWPCFESSRVNKPRTASLTVCISGADEKWSPLRQSKAVNQTFISPLK